MTVYRVLAAVLAPLVVGAAANYYLDLGWFGNRGKLVLTISLLLACVLLAMATRHDQATKARQD